MKFIVSKTIINYVKIIFILLFFLILFPQSAQAALTHTWDATTSALIITSDADDDIVITRETTPPHTAVLVNGNWLDDGTGNSIHADDIKRIVVMGGPGDNLIDLSAVTTGDFPNLSILIDPIDLDGGAGNDTIIGSAFDDIIDGGDGNDQLHGGPGHDSLFGRSGDDIMYGGPGADTLRDGPGNDKLYPGPGHDYCAPQPGSTDILNDSTGVDTLSFSLAAMAIIIDLDLLDAVQLVNYENDSIKLEGIFENFIGSPFDDVIHVDPLDVPRSIDGGGSVNGDTIYVETRGETPVDDGTTITYAGYEPITYTNFTEVVFETTLSAEANPNIPKSFTLHQNYPNPFNPSTTIDYNVPHGSHVTIEIFDINGKLINTIVNNYKRTGTYSVNWDGRDSDNKFVGTGTYFYRFKSNGLELSKKMLLMK